MLEILTRLCNGEARAGDLEKLEHLAHVVAKQSLCGLGKTAPNPVLTSLKYFRDEFAAHLEGRCPAKRCKKLITYTISDRCIGCCKCQRQCADNAITGDPYQPHRIDPEKCTRCDLCRQVCPVKAITVESGKGGE
jgi:ferredoxin